jgi:hypothetical protein
MHNNFVKKNPKPPKIGNSNSGALTITRNLTIKMVEITYILIKFTLLQLLKFTWRKS